MSHKQRKPKIGRPGVLGTGAQFLTVCFTAQQMKAINRLAGPAPGRRPAVIRDLLDVGLKAARRR